MKLEVDLISQNIVKPSSPTPPHRHHYQLSFLDQIMIPLYVPWVFFYLDDDSKVDNREKCDRVKRSLSEALALFYPIAGRLVGNTHVECDDKGVHFIEAEANCKILDFIENPNCNEINKLLPFEIDDANVDSLAFVQVTYFECGGMSVGLGLSHKLGDAMSSFMFLNTWAAISRGGSNPIAPFFDSATHFPPINLHGFCPQVVKDDIITKRFVFDACSIASLREKYTEKDNIEHQIHRPTRVEALSTFIWSRFKAATEITGDAPKIYTLGHAVNLRPKMSPPSWQQYFGNIFVQQRVELPNMDDENEACVVTIKKMRKAIRNVDQDYVKKLRGDEHLNTMLEGAERYIKGETVCLNFTSWCRFQVYEVDFGWGKPVWVGSARWPFHNLVTFLDTKKGDGIEAWIHLREEDMSKFEADHELNALVSQNPNQELVTV
ncbi:hypothetical protein K2173_019391 [Erythroxylum novogranatense]|uniref:Vinorine synthase-like n=1 Tax=Erythroxylum novogranatense TaxID=1862640 RepID=A0AAV8UF37_9ROSI|nr:hypothetical protein K2173_019391 [Erythroxylum novogranatense]